MSTKGRDLFAVISDESPLQGFPLLGPCFKTGRMETCLGQTVRANEILMSGLRESTAAKVTVGFWNRYHGAARIRMCLPGTMYRYATGDVSGERDGALETSGTTTRHRHSALEVNPKSKGRPSERNLGS